MTIYEQRFMETVPSSLHTIAEELKALTVALKPRLVPINAHTDINPREVIGVGVDDDGLVSISIRNGAVFDTFFETKQEAYAALGFAS